MSSVLMVFHEGRDFVRDLVRVRRLAGAEIARQLSHVLRVATPDEALVIHGTVRVVVLLRPFLVAHVKLRMGADVIVELLREAVALDVELTLPVLLLIRDVTQIDFAEQVLALDDVIEGDAERRALQDVVHDHEDRRAAHAGETMIVEPGIFRKLPVEVEELVYLHKTCPAWSERYSGSSRALSPKSSCLRKHSHLSTPSLTASRHHVSSP